ncbi:MAG: PqqD family protein [Clostridia bacterium]|nr:PqqD family protein [Clostridia bacterium]
MKVRSDFVVRSVAGSNVVVPTGAATVDFNGIMTLNDTGMFLWGLLEKGAQKEDLLKALLSEYDVDEATAKEDIEKFLTKLQEAGLVE